VRPATRCYRRVLVAFGDQIVFEDTLDQALDTLFGGDSGAGNAIVPVTEDDTTIVSPTEGKDTSTDNAEIDVQLTAL
jgi:hypothetical protein